MTRSVVVQLWSGTTVVRRLRFAAADQASHVDSMSDEAVTQNLRRLGVAVPAEIAEQRARLKAWPTQADLDAIATAHIAANDGVRPVARVLEDSSLPGGRLGAAGSGAS